MTHDAYAAAVIADAECDAAAEALLRCALDALRAIGCGDDPIAVEAERMLRERAERGRPS